MKLNETFELSFQGEVLENNYALIDLLAVFVNGDTSVTVKGFYDGEGVYKIRFLPEKTGVWSWKVTGLFEEEGEEECVSSGSHGIVRAEGTHFAYSDGPVYMPFGTTVYAMASQPDDLVEETLETLKNAPFNKLRTCVFPKHFKYNGNEPPYYAFRCMNDVYQENDGSQWDVNTPDLNFWHRFEKILKRLEYLDIQVDLILFHPYDCWGFSRMGLQNDLVYLEYLLRRLSAFPHIWWSLANEYDLCEDKTMEDWYAIEQYVHDHDPYHHLLSNHHCIAPWDTGRENITHGSYQTAVFNLIDDIQKETGKPVMIDECRYEGNLPEQWGCISGKNMVDRFWKVCTVGGYCTHGETFITEDVNDEDDVVFWAKGGKLQGESIPRIAWMRKFFESLPPLRHNNGQLMTMFSAAEAENYEDLKQSLPADIRVFTDSYRRLQSPYKEQYDAAIFEYNGRYEDEILLSYLGDQKGISTPIVLPEGNTYRIDVIDTWNMTRETVLEGASGLVYVKTLEKEMTAVLAVKEK